MIKRSRLWTGKPPAGTPADYSNPINRGLVGWWQMNEGGGTTPADLSTRRKSPSFVGGPTWGFGRAGSPTTLNFDGTDDGLSVALDLSGTDKVSLSFWMNWTTFANNDDLAFEYTANGNNKNGFLIDPNDSGGKFAFGTSNTGFVYWTDTFTRPSAGVWHHYVLTMERGTANTAHVDGVLQTLTTQNHTGTTGNFDNSSLYFMCRAGTSLFGAGSLDNVRVYDRILSASEARSLYYDPDQGFFERTSYLFAPPAAAGLTVTGILGEATASGFTATVDQQRIIAGSVGTATASGFTATVDQQNTITTTIGTATASGFDASVALGDLVVTGIIGTATASGYTATVDQQQAISGIIGTATASSYTAALEFGGFTADQLAFLVYWMENNMTIPTAAQIADAVLAAAQTTPIHSDVRKVNSYTVDGTGTDGDPWGPA